MPKMCIPSPTVLHFRLEPNAVDKKAYAEQRRDLLRPVGGVSQGA